MADKLEDLVQFGTQGIRQLATVITHKEDKLSQPGAELHARFNVHLPLIKLANVVKDKIQHFLASLLNFQSVLALFRELWPARSLQLLTLDVDQAENFNLKLLLLFLRQVVEVRLQLMHTLAVTCIYKLYHHSLT